MGSAVQSSEIIKLIRPTDVMLELDEKRAVSMFDDESIHQHALAEELFEAKTWCDPIILFLRMGSRCMSYFAELGDEFKQCAIAAMDVPDCRLVFGDQESSKTCKSVQVATPFWLKIVLNCIIIFGFGGQFALSMYVVGMEVIGCIRAQCFVLLACKSFIVYAAWLAYTFWSKLFIQVWAEESKNSMQRVLKFYAFLGMLVPFITKALSESDLKGKRDHILADSALNCINGGEHGKKRKKLIVCVVGLAHMENMHQIVKKKMESDEVNDGVDITRE